MIPAFLIAAATMGPVVTNIVDGDTFDLDDGRRVRLAYIDAPEATQPGGQHAKAALLGLILDRTVTLRDVTDAAYGRVQARVAWRNWDIGASMLSKGHAWCDERYMPAYVAAAYRDKQAKAQAARRGLWSGLDPVAPWDWRAATSSPDSWTAPTARVTRVTQMTQTPRQTLPPPPQMIPRRYAPTPIMIPFSGGFGGFSSGGT